MNDVTELDLLAPLGKVDAPSEETMREVAALLAAESGSKPVSRRRSGKRNLAIGVGAVAAAAAVFAVVSLNGSIAGPRNPAGGDPDLRTLVLTAFDANANSILHVTMTAVHNGPGPEQPVAHLWYSSAQPRAGQSLTVRDIVAPTSSSAEQDASETYVVTDAGSTPANCDVLQVRYDLREWTKRVSGCPYLGEPQLELEKELAEGSWHRVPGQTTVDGQPAVQYTREDDGDHARGVGNSYRTLSINASTNLPISDQLKGFAADGTLADTVTTAFSFLPDTEQNRAQLTVPIPAGFTQVPEFPPTRH